MNRFAKVMQLLGWAGAALLTVAWAQGFVAPDDSLELARHSRIALAAACLCILPRFWTMAFLALAARGRKALRKLPVASSAAATSGPSSPSNGSVARVRSARLRRLAFVAGVLAVGGLVGTFGLAGAILIHRASPLPHSIAGFVGIALQIAALVLERRALLADAQEMAALAERLPSAAAVPDGSPIRASS